MTRDTRNLPLPPTSPWDGVQRTIRVTSHCLAVSLWWGLRMSRRLVLFVLLTVLILAEPLVRIVLVPLATLSALMAIVFGFVLHAPHFHAWGMLAFGVGALWLYWLYVLLMHWIGRGIA